MLKLITSLFTNFASIEDSASPKQELRFLERFEARAGWVSASNAGLVVLCFALGPYGSHTIHSGTRGMISYKERGVEEWRLGSDPSQHFSDLFDFGLRL